jgi:plasmid stabilization system protein ParE
MTNYHLTSTALAQLDEAVRKTARKWGLTQAMIYKAAMEKGFEKIATRGESIMTDFCSDMAKGSDFSLHLVEHHYVAFKAHDKDNIIIAGVFHEKMNIPVKLKNLQQMSRSEISDLEDEINRDAATGPASR